jgi:metal-sulfur cluster biosynthetic enzyme
MAFKPKFLASGIGSMPFTDPEQAVEISLTRLSEAPFWPQLPKLGMNEQMEIQYSEGIPCIKIDRAKERIFFDTSGDYSEIFAEFYETYMKAMDHVDGNGDCSALGISSDFSKGIYAFEKRLQKKSGKLPFVKVQTTGPCSFALTIVDENKRAIYYNEEFRDVVIKALTMKCRWQIQKFQPYAEKVICFVDEPILSAFGSSTYVSVKREDVVAHLREVIDAIHTDKALVGIHCCGNTEWSILIDAGVDIVNFDAFGFGETIAMYPEAVKAHLQRGGALAWGIVPTSTAIREKKIEDLISIFEKLIDHLASRGIDKQLIVEQSLITPSCGTGSMEPNDAEKVFAMTESLSKTMRKKYGF